MWPFPSSLPMSHFSKPPLSFAWASVAPSFWSLHVRPPFRSISGFSALWPEALGQAPSPVRLWPWTSPLDSLLTCVDPALPAPVSKPFPQLTRQVLTSGFSLIVLSAPNTILPELSVGDSFSLPSGFGAEVTSRKKISLRAVLSRKTPP